MIISGISNPSSQGGLLIERPSSTQANTQTPPQNSTQTDNPSVSMAETASPKAENSSINLSPTAIKLQTQDGSTQMPDSGKSSELLVEPANRKDTSEKGESAQSSGVKSFAYGALGMDHPDKVEEKEDDSYTAGQYLKAAATIGSVIALFV